MSGPVQKIKERLGIAEVLSSYLKLEKAGGNFKAKCPFHNEKTASFFISPSRGGYYCFGCGAKGDIFTFVQEFEGLDFPGALKTLAARAGVTLLQEDPKKKSERDRLYALMEEATIYYEREFEQFPAGIEYLLKRGLVTTTIKKFRIGYAPLEWRALSEYLTASGYSAVELAKAGLTKTPDSAETTEHKRAYDRFRGRIMFPLFDSSGRTIAFSGRIFVDDGKSPKYLNSPDTVLFNKSDVLYGIDKAKLEIRKKNFSILVEGQMDLLMAHQIGYCNTVAVSGTALSHSTLQSASVGEKEMVNNLGIVQRLSNNIVISYDSDKAGIASAGKSAKIALGLGMDVKLAQLPEGLDPADLILKDPSAWKEAIKNSQNVVDFYLTHLQSTISDERKFAKEVQRLVFPYVRMVRNKIDQEHFVSKIAKTLNVSSAAVFEELAKVSNEESTEVPKKPELPQRPNESLERKIQSVLLWQESMPEPFIKPEVLKRKMGELGVTFKEKEFDEQEKNEMIFEAEITYDSAEKLRTHLAEFLKHAQIAMLDRTISETMKLIKDVSQPKAEHERSMNEIEQLTRKRDKVKNTPLQDFIL